MNTKLLKKIRQRYCIRLDETHLFYTVYDRFMPKRYPYLDRYELFYTVLPDIYGSKSALKIINKHNQKMKVREIKTLAIANGYTEKDIPWLKKE